MDLLDTQLPSSAASDVESSVEAALKPVAKSDTRLAKRAKAVKTDAIKAVKTEAIKAGKTETTNTTEMETEAAPMAEVRSLMVESFRRVDLLDLINYIHKQRKFSVHQRVPAASSVHLRQFKRQSVFKAIYYRGDEATQSVREVDAVETDLAGGYGVCG